jgi:uncharacterized protein involved in exopolysaccharide biosynthesis
MTSAEPGFTLDDGDAEESGFDLGVVVDYASFVLRSLRRHVLATLFIAVLGVAGTLQVVKALPRIYRVSTTVLVTGDSLVAPLTTGVADRVTTTKGVPELVLKRENLISLIRQANLVERWKATRDPIRRIKDKVFALFRRAGPVNDDELVDGLVFTLERSLSVVTDDRTVTIEVSWRDPDAAYQIAAAAQQNFLEARLLAETSAITDSITILESHLATARQQVEAALANAQASRTKQARQADKPIVPTPTENRATRSPEAIAESVRLQGQLDAKRRAVEDLEQLRRRRLAELQQQYAEQRAVYAASHPLLVNLQESIRALSQDSTQLAQLRQEAHDLESEYASVGGSIEEAQDSGLAARRSAPSLILRELPTRDPREELDRLQLTNATAKFNALLDRINSARLTLDTTRGSFRYRYSVIRPPLPPKAPVSPQANLLYAGGLAASIVAGILVALGLELRKGLISQAWQIRRSLGIRLLAELPAESAVRAGPTTI